MRADPPAIHATAVVEPGARIGAGTRVWHFAHVRGGARIGAGCTVGKDVYVDAGVTVGDRCKIQNGANLYRGVSLGAGVFVGPGAQFTNDRHPRAELWDDGRLAKTRVAAGASIGANATVVCGTSIGRYAVVGAGAVVTRDVPPHGVVVGNPARLRGFACRCGLPLRGGPEGGSGAVFLCPCGSRTRVPRTLQAQVRQVQA